MARKHGCSKLEPDTTSVSTVSRYLRNRQWARKGKVFQAEHDLYDLSNLENDDLEKAWLRWVQIEVKKR